MTLPRKPLTEAESISAVADEPFRRVADGEPSWSPDSGRERTTVGRDVGMADPWAA